MTVRPTRPVGVCILCGNRRKLTDEDVIPQWLMRHAFPHPRKISKTRGSSRDEFMANLRVGKTGQREKVTVLCEICNSRWLSRIENRVKPRLLAWMSGVHGPLTLADQQLIGFWSVKTVLMVQLAYPRAQRRIPPRFYRDLHEARDRPPDGMYVWIGITQDRWPGIKFGMRDISRLLRNMKVVAAFQADLIVHRLFIRVSGVDPVDSLSDIEMLPSAGTSLIRIWPSESLLLDDLSSESRLRERGRAVFVPG